MLLQVHKAYDNFPLFLGVVGKSITSLSRGTAILLLLTYAAYLIFQLKTHASIYNAPSPKNDKRERKYDMKRSLVRSSDVVSAVGGGSITHDARQARLQDSQVDNNEEKPQLSLWVAILTLAVSTALVGICAEFMTSAINKISPPDGSGKLPRTFVALILLPIVGNATEHATAVNVALKDKMDLAVAVAIGSSLQIALLVVPVLVVIGWILGNESMNLTFDGFQIAVLFVAVLLINYLIQDGKSNWLVHFMI